MSKRGGADKGASENSHFALGHTTHTVPQHHFFQESFSKEERDRGQFRKRGPPAVGRNPLLSEETPRSEWEPATGRSGVSRATPRSARSVPSTARSDASTYVNPARLAELHMRKEILEREIAALDKRISKKAKEVKSAKADRPFAMFPSTARDAMKTTNSLAYDSGAAASEGPAASLRVRACVCWVARA
eukprot:CAMPEP_0203817510 /NCGR_PEP_ID=MMETSP0115-20131106/26519_1 /ASSEMBLY_ACC=CAM_ASM_000227 /TAXON_ID=33651 /ORGANISM="Bicosoecid sp, Strain ms1" /LENGTH=188 /DNA_ID=CAMNT_0050726443 /DNA_START=216 /DNA_END=780 /DNA_ORIENTATION=+